MDQNESEVNVRWAEEMALVAAEKKHVDEGAVTGEEQLMWSIYFHQDLMVLIVEV